MGGFGSGQRWSRKRTVEACCCLDTASLNRWRMLTPGTADRVGSFEWGAGDRKSSVGYRLTVGEADGTLRLLYATRSPDAEVDYPVRLVTTPCHLGGVRWWFVCPLARDGVACGRRVRKVYLRGRYFGCRHCHDLTYRSTQESDSRVYAALRGGFSLDRLGDPTRMSVAQLGFALRVLTSQQKRLDRVARRVGGSGALPAPPGGHLAQGLRCGEWSGRMVRRERGGLRSGTWGGG
jgi:hypothetical protein